MPKLNSQQIRDFLKILAGWEQKGMLEGEHGSGLKRILNMFGPKRKAEGGTGSSLPASGAKLEGHKVTRRGRRVENDGNGDE